MLLLSVAIGERVPDAPPVRASLAVAYLCVFGSLVGFTAYAFLLRHTRASVATSYAYVNPVIALLLGVLMAGERIDLASGIGAVIVLAAVLLVSQGRRTQNQPVRSASLAPLAVKSG